MAILHLRGPQCVTLVYQTQVGTLNYMPPEAIKDTSSQPGKARSKVLVFTLADF